VRALLTTRNSALYLLGQTVSAFGDSALWLVAAVWIVQLTGSVALAGLTFFFLTAPSVLAPFAGLLIDRVNRRPLLVTGNLLSAAVVLLLLMVHDRDDVWLVYLVMTLYGLSNTVLDSAPSALLPSLVPRSQIGQMNALLRSAREALRVIAPPVGTGIFVAFGGGFVAVVDAASFLIATSALLLLHPQKRQPSAVAR
jgi:MFS family permease